MAAEAVRGNVVSDNGFSSSSRSLEPEQGERSSYAAAITESRKAKADESAMVSAMEAASAEGDPRAHYALATWYIHGTYGYPEAPARAIPLLRAAAEASVREAMFDLAVSYDSGIGVEEDPRRAFLWYLRAAVRGDPDAVGMVANYTATGRGTEVDDDAALVWYELAELLGVDVEDALAFQQLMRDNNGQ